MTDTFICAPLTVVCGGIGTGKSIAVLECFTDSFEIMTSANNQHFYKTRLMGKWKDRGLRPPKKTQLIDTSATALSAEYKFIEPSDVKTIKDADGNIVQTQTKEKVERLIYTLRKKSFEAVEKKEPLPFRSLIIDEMGELLDRVHAEILPTCLTGGGKIDTRGAFGESGQWVHNFVGGLRELTSLGVGVCLVMHDRDPEEEKKGGPKATSIGMARKISALADNVIQRVLRDPPPGAKNEDGTPRRAERLWLATAGERWERKMRGLEPEDEDIIQTMSLLEIHRLCGFIW